MYEDEEEENNEKNLRSTSHKYRVINDKKTSYSSLPQNEKQMFTSHPGASLTFSMFINLSI